MFRFVFYLFIFFLFDYTGFYPEGLYLAVKTLMWAYVRECQAHILRHQGLYWKVNEQC